jgi:acyl-coenzyme A synthetase/AMP-(fatty) acid ligase
MIRTIFKQIESHASFTPMKPAIMQPDRMINYRMLIEGIRSAQHVLKDLDLDRNYPVGLLVGSPIRHVIVFLALLRSGFTVTSMREEHIDLAAQIGTQVVITDRNIAFARLRIYKVEDRWFQNNSKTRIGEERFEADRIARILFTSGSTGLPKAVGWSFSTLHKRIQDISNLGFCIGDRLATTYGLSSTGLRYALGALHKGDTCIVSDPDTLLDMALNYCVDAVRCSAIQAEAIIKMQDQLDYPVTFKFISVGGSRLKNETAWKLKKMFRAEIVSSYASTEGGTVALARGSIMDIREKRGNCFVPIEEIQVANTHGGQAGSGEEGTIRVKSNNMGWEFRGNLTETDDVKGNGWFYPGDTGYIDDDGLLVVTGRADEVINLGGVKVAPEVIEEKIRSHPKISDAAAVRVTFDPDNTQLCLAVVSPEDMTLEEINAWLLGQVLGELRTIQFAQMIKLSAIPKTGNEKIAREELRRLFKENDKTRRP